MEDWISLKIIKLITGLGKSKTNFLDYIIQILKQVMPNPKGAIVSNAVQKEKTHYKAARTYA
jgi:hypothetical protein